MSTKTFTLYEALQEKKLLEKRTSRKFSERFVDVINKHSEENMLHIPKADVEADIKSKYASTVALYNNLVALKAAINEANAKTMITIGDKVYSIADAIARHRMLDIEQNIYTKMLADIATLEKTITDNDRLNLSPDAVSMYISNVLGDSKKDPDTVAKLEADYREKHTLELFDPLNTKELAERKLKEIEDFREKFHYALTVANCNTTIDVEYED